MKKIILLVVLAVIACFILLRPSDISQEKLTSEYENHKAAFVSIASYLTKNNISVEINDVMVAGRESGVPNKDEDAYKEFNEAVEELMSTSFQKIVSDGKTITFEYKDNGGILNRLNGSVIYNQANNVGGKNTVRLGEHGWHLYIEQRK